jgi:hypothetical protein
MEATFSLSGRSFMNQLYAIDVNKPAPEIFRVLPQDLVAVELRTVGR